jgi:hypothetical protein
VIDDYDRAMELIRKMEAHLPIPAQPAVTLVRALRDQGKTIARDEELQIQSVSYAGDEGGIMCGMALSEEAKEALVISLTHLQVGARHPLAQEIRAYQVERARRLAQSETPRKPHSFTVRPHKRKRRR